MNPQPMPMEKEQTDANALTMDQALEALGVNEQTLSPRHQDELDRNGFTVFHNVIDPAWLAQLRETFERITSEEGADAGKEVSQMIGIRRLADLVNKGEVFDHIYTNPLVLAAAR